ncbi:MAG: hypothetical protein HS132_02735 [Planctomycetia bacterium]|nr:hypothetical protein [Planctomycetia bacterium]
MKVRFAQVLLISEYVKELKRQNNLYSLFWLWLMKTADMVKKVELRMFEEIARFAYAWEG